MLNLLFLFVQVSGFCSSSPFCMCSLKSCSVCVCQYEKFCHPSWSLATGWLVVHVANSAMPHVCSTCRSQNWTRVLLMSQFLRCREAWLVGIIDDLDQSNPYEYLKRMADCHRVHLFDVVNQYRAIFSDDTSGHEENTDGGLLYSWAMHRISSHLNVLHEVLPQITEGPNLAIILEQCMVYDSLTCLLF